MNQSGPPFALKNSPRQQLMDEVSKYLAQMKNILYGEGDSEPNPDTVAQLANEVYNTDLLQVLISNVSSFEFEAKKDVAQVFNNLLRRQIGTRSPTVEYICRNPTILEMLLAGYTNPDIALNCGSMLRECIRHEPLAKIMLLSQSFYDFFTYVESANFDSASDAFASMKDLLTKHKALCAEFLEKNFETVFEYYHKLLHSKNYVTRRVSLKLLGELLLDRANFNVMTRYISDQENLKLMMNLLKDKHKSIQFEAFHVFKVFVANPNKTKPIMDVLIRNKDRLIAFLTDFHNDKADDDQFNEEKALLLREISNLPSKR